jgi:N-methylhydantoinase B/oxoprolinase/acetone carboxylase alpha subunit
MARGRLLLGGGPWAYEGGRQGNLREQHQRQQEQSEERCMEQRVQENEEEKGSCRDRGVVGQGGGAGFNAQSVWSPPGARIERHSAVWASWAKSVVVCTGSKRGGRHSCVG